MHRLIPFTMNTHPTAQRNEGTKTPLMLLASLIGGALFLATSLLAVNAAPPAANVSFASGPEKVSLVELYTSEGCSSCPPADRWLSGISEGDELWKKVVPVAFHVSYWDRLGWPDRFAQREFDTRQRRLAARADSGVYTPGMFKDGAEYRSWRRTPPNEVAEQSRPAAAGELTISRVEGNEWVVTYEPANPTTKPDQVFAAVLGNKLSNAVARGENAGRRLDHDFVVLQLERAALNKSSADAQTLQARFTLDTDVTEHPALAAWVTNGSGQPLQAVGGAL